MSIHERALVIHPLPPAVERAEFDRKKAQVEAQIDKNLKNVISYPNRLKTSEQSISVSVIEDWTTRPRLSPQDRYSQQEHDEVLRSIPTRNAQAIAAFEQAYHPRNSNIPCEEKVYVRLGSQDSWEEKLMGKAGLKLHNSFKFIDVRLKPTTGEEGIWVYQLFLERSSKIRAFREISGPEGIRAESKIERTPALGDLKGFSAILASLEPRKH